MAKGSQHGDSIDATTHQQSMQEEETNNMKQHDFLELTTHLKSGSWIGADIPSRPKASIWKNSGCAASFESLWNVKGKGDQWWLRSTASSTQSNRRRRLGRTQRLHKAFQNLGEITSAKSSSVRAVDSRTACPSRQKNTTSDNKEYPQQ